MNSFDWIVSRWPPRFRELYEERAAIKEFQGNLPREQAEKEALAEIQEQMKP